MDAAYHSHKKRLLHTGWIWLSAISLLFLLGACQPHANQGSPPQDQLQVTVSILPQAYFVERIGGDSVAINIMVGPGEEAHTYEPKPEQMKALTDTDMFFSMGIEYERTWLPKFKDIQPDLLVIDVSSGIQRISQTQDHDHQNEGGEAEDEHDQNLDPHVWLSPENGKIIAKNILTALIQLEPHNTDLFTTNFDNLIEDINSLDQTIQATLSKSKNRSFMVFHPAWGYFAQQYKLEQLAFQIGGQDPSPAELAEIVKKARNEGIRVIFIQPTFNTSSVSALSNEIGAEVALVDPLARDWLENLKQVAQAFSAALEISE